LPGPPLFVSRFALQRGEVHRSLLAATVFFQLERDALAFVEVGHAGTFDGRDVDKGVGAAVFTLDEAEALLTVEELDRTIDALAVGGRGSIAIAWRPRRTVSGAAPGRAPWRRASPGPAASARAGWL
jgi:hypothetical protein